MIAMKIYRLIYAAVLAGSVMLSSCDEEKDYYVYDGTIPLMCDNLYMVGSATPAGWNINAPTPLTVSPDDKYIYEYDSFLKEGEIKFVISTGNWQAPFIRPTESGAVIDETDIVDYRFQHTLETETGDLKWNVTKAGRYHIRFDLRNWTMTVRYVVFDNTRPIATPTIYMLGDATSASWSVDAPIELTRSETSETLFDWTGYLIKGSFRFFTTKGMWTQPFLRPIVDATPVGTEPTENSFQYDIDSEDSNWKVTKPGIYHITVDLEKWTMATEYIKHSAGTPIPGSNLYMIGSAVPALWAIAGPTPLEPNAAVQGLFEWEGWLYTGQMKMLTRRGTWEQHFIRPEVNETTIGEQGINDGKLMFTLDEETGDNKWIVDKAGYYRMRVDLNACTWDCEYVDYDYTEPIETATLYMLGSATPNGDNNASPTALTPSNDNSYLFEWTGKLKCGTIKFFTTPGTLIQPFIRPVKDREVIGEAGLDKREFIYSMAPNGGDLMWQVTHEGNYSLTVDLMNHTITVKYIN